MGFERQLNFALAVSRLSKQRRLERQRRLPTALLLQHALQIILALQQALQRAAGASRRQAAGPRRSGPGAGHAAGRSWPVGPGGWTGRAHAVHWAGLPASPRRRQRPPAPAHARRSVLGPPPPLARCARPPRRSPALGTTQKRPECWQTRPRAAVTKLALAISIPTYKLSMAAPATKCRTDQSSRCFA